MDAASASPSATRARPRRSKPRGESHRRFTCSATGPSLSSTATSSATSTSPVSLGPRWNKISRIWYSSRIRRITRNLSRCAERRHALQLRMGKGAAIIPTAPERIRNRDSDYLYRFDSYFYYLSGFPEPEAVLVLLAGEEPRSILFCRERNPERELWEGVRNGPEGA